MLLLPEARDRGPTQHAFPQCTGLGPVRRQEGEPMD